ncbi:putative ORFan [Tupanvirus deep ocean]|uniref:ORFan n=2 Tax=Tupanvirus TaxID=2094720 RepID=A0AC62A8V6_9VIRU|nr:putative ORFan [Tupanvirus deep ocean]QKU34098.1 putative ORFan [Tupanvirus deep ocean]
MVSFVGGPLTKDTNAAPVGIEPNTSKGLRFSRPVLLPLSHSAY